MTQSAVKHAQDLLGDRLRELFGPDLPGVYGFGAGLDRSTQRMTLKVAVDGPSTAERASASLPESIGGLRVDIEQRSPVRGGAI